MFFFQVARFFFFLELAYFFPEVARTSCDLLHENPQPLRVLDNGPRCLVRSALVPRKHALAVGLHLVARWVRAFQPQYLHGQTEARAAA